MKAHFLANVVSVCRLYDAGSGVVMARYEIHRILFYAHGTAESKEAACFSFTYTQGETVESSIFQCHVFRCDIPEAVSILNICFLLWDMKIGTFWPEYHKYKSYHYNKSNKSWKFI